MRIAKRVIVLLSGAFAMPSSGAAQYLYDNICATSSSLKACASADVTYNVTAGEIVLKFWNMETHDDFNHLNGQRHTITAVGLAYLGQNDNSTSAPTATSYSIDWFKADGSVVNYNNSWQLDSNKLQVNLGSQTTGHKDGVVGCHDPGGATHVSTCVSGASSSFPNKPYMQLTLKGVSGLQSDLEKYYFEFHSQQVGPDEGSLKGSSPPSDVVPEPMSMVLLGSGLAGIGAMKLRRRRKESEQDQLV